MNISLAMATLVVWLFFMGEVMSLELHLPCGYADFVESAISSVTGIGDP